MTYLSRRCVPCRDLDETDFSLPLAPAPARTPSRAGCRDVTGTGCFPGGSLGQAQVDPWQLDLSPLILPVHQSFSLGVLNIHCFRNLPLRCISSVNSRHFHHKVSDLHPPSMLLHTMHMEHTVFAFLNNTFSVFSTSGERIPRRFSNIPSVALLTSHFIRHSCASATSSLSFTATYHTHLFVSTLSALKRV